MTQPEAPPIITEGTHPWTTVKPPPMAGMVVQYLTPLMFPIPVSTRRPAPDPDQDITYPNGYVRCEAAGGVWMARSEIFFDASAIVHSYVDYEHEPEGEDICGTALGWCGNAQGLTIPITNSLTGTTEEWFITYSRITALATIKADPLVRMTRFRGMATWRVQGVALAPVGAS